MPKKSSGVPKIRRSWRINPATRIVKNRKRYSRRKKKRIIRDEIETWTSQG